MPIVEGDNSAAAMASPTSSSAHPVLSPSSIPSISSPPPALPQYFQPPHNSQHSANVMAEGNQKQQQTHNIAQQPAQPLVPGLDAASYESQHQVLLQADGSSSVCTSNSSSASKEAVILGLQALERQQEDLERKQQEELERKRATMRSSAVQRDNPFDASPQQHGNRYSQDPIYQGDIPSTVHLPGEEDSQKTLSSIHLENSARDRKGKRSIVKFIRSSLRGKKNTNRKLRNKADNCVKQDSGAQLSINVNPYENDLAANNKSTLSDKPIISGYLYKRGRQGKWQRRWFESDGRDLCYFKSDKRNKLLATLDLLNVGSVRMDDTDPAGCSFIIEVAGRNYYLCADSKDYAMDWVISMNRIREARMKIGNLRLITPLQNEIKVLDEDYAPRVVILAGRKRSKGLGKEDFNKNLDDLNTGLTEALSPVSGASMVSSNVSSRHRVSEDGKQGADRRKGISVRWRKHRPSYQNWIRRLSRWAQRLRSVRCVVKDDFQHLGNSAEARHSQEKVQSPQLVETDDSKPHVKYEGDVTGRGLVTSNTLEGAVDPIKKYPQYTDLDPEVRKSNILEYNFLSSDF